MNIDAAKELASRYLAPTVVVILVLGKRRRCQVESAGKSRQRVKGESPYIVMASDQL